MPSVFILFPNLFREARCISFFVLLNRKMIQKYITQLIAQMLGIYILYLNLFRDVRYHKAKMMPAVAGINVNETMTAGEKCIN